MIETIVFPPTCIRDACSYFVKVFNLVSTFSFHGRPMKKKMNKQTDTYYTDMQNKKQKTCVFDIWTIEHLLFLLKHRYQNLLPVRNNGNIFCRYRSPTKLLPSVVSVTESVSSVRSNTSETTGNARARFAVQHLANHNECIEHVFRYKPIRRIHRHAIGTLSAGDVL